MRNRIIPLLVLLCLTQLGFATQTIVEGGSLPQYSHWTAEGSPYLITGDLDLPEGSILEVDEGAEVIYYGNFEIRVSGTLQVGKLGERVVKWHGRDLGNEKFVLWKGIVAVHDEARILINNVYMSHAREAFDLSKFSYMGTGTCPQFRSRDCIFDNNLVIFSCGENGGDIEVINSSFINNDKVCLGKIGLIDASTPAAKMDFHSCTFKSNNTAIEGCRFTADYCIFEENDTAIWDAPYSYIDSTSFVNNGIGIQTHSSVIVHTTFTDHVYAILLGTPQPGRDLLQTGTQIEYCSFESNQLGIFIKTASEVDLIGCNNFDDNVLAMHLPSLQVQNNKLPYRVERNSFMGNQTCLNFSNLIPGPLVGSDKDSMRIVLHFNYFNDNNLLIRNGSHYHVNFLRNYVIGTLPYLNSAIVDGDDSTGYGLVNFTVCIDSQRNGNTITIQKFEDVLKHKEYDTADVVGNSFSYTVCDALPGNPTLVANNMEDFRVRTYPNPFRSALVVRSEKEAVAFKVLDLNGREHTFRQYRISKTEWQLETGNLKPGLYILWILDNEHQARSVKVIKAG